MKTIAPEVGPPEVLASTLSGRLQAFLAPLLVRLDEALDRRLVKTFAATIEVFLRQRYRATGLLLSELGAYLTSPAHAPAGTKRLSNLLRSRYWDAELILRYLWERADARLAELEQSGQDALLLWDESVLEKPESTEAHGLCPVRSSKAARLKRIRPGFYHPPGGPPVFVPGLHWLSLLLIGRSGPPTLAHMQWWTTRGALASERRWEEEALLARAASAWGRRVVHVFDRGFAGTPWLQELARRRMRFVLRWPKRYHRIAASGEELCAWEIARGKRTWERRTVPSRGRERVRGVLALPVHHPGFEEPLWLVLSRPAEGGEPWYLLTNEPVPDAAAAWKVVLAYARRWQVEMSFRFNKTELAMESPRLWRWSRRLKLLAMVALTYAFLLTLLQPDLERLRGDLLRSFCPRTGKRSQAALAPLYRLRAAICFLFLSLRTLPPPQSSG